MTDRNVSCQPLVRVRVPIHGVRLRRREAARSWNALQASVGDCCTVEKVGLSSTDIVGIGSWVGLAGCWGGKPPLPLFAFS